MAKTPDSQKRLLNDEGPLLDYVQPLKKHGHGRRVVKLHLFALRSFNRR